MTSARESAIERLADEIERGYHGDPWHGGSTREILAGVDARTAAGRPIPAAHTIGEIVAHLTSWTFEIARRLAGGEPAPPSAGDWPVPAGSSAAEWQQALVELDRAHADLVQALRRFPPERLGDPMGTERHQALGTGLTVEGTLHGVSQHLAYHTGQIALLRKSFK
ncbi:MAG TPA: DinB family protein [Candidatus Udaeobacter sp.]|nr:DinB family protein [Candidatus Udaeobacter sp.]